MLFSAAVTLVVILELLLLFSISFLFLLLAVLDGAFTIGLVLLYNLLLEIKLFQSLVHLGTFNTTSKWTGCLRKLESVSFSQDKQNSGKFKRKLTALGDWVDRWFRRARLAPC